MAEYSVRIIQDPLNVSDPRVITFDENCLVGDLVEATIKSAITRGIIRTEIDASDVLVERNGMLIRRDLPLNSHLHNPPIQRTDVLSLRMVRRIPLSFRIVAGLKSPYEFTVSVDPELPLEKEERFTSHLTLIGAKLRPWGRKPRRFGLRARGLTFSTSTTPAQLAVPKGEWVELRPRVLFEWPPRFVWPPPPVTAYSSVLLVMIILTMILWPPKQFEYYAVHYNTQPIIVDPPKENGLVRDQSPVHLGLGINVLTVFPEKAPYYFDTVEVNPRSKRWWQDFKPDTTTGGVYMCIGDTIVLYRDVKSSTDSMELEISVRSSITGLALPKVPLFYLNHRELLVNDSEYKNDHDQRVLKNSKVAVGSPFLLKWTLHQGEFIESISQEGSPIPFTPDSLVFGAGTFSSNRTTSSGKTFIVVLIKREKKS